MYDLIIIGGGPAAMSAGIYAARKKIKVLILTKIMGGQMLESFEIDNYLGLPEISGKQLSDKFADHLKSYASGGFELDIKEGGDVKNIKSVSAAEAVVSGLKINEEILPKNIFEVHTPKEIYQAKSVIIATGKTERKLSIPGAAQFEGKGISYCATCDAPIFRNKTVAVIGGGDAAQDTAWQLLDYASKIYILSRYDQLKGSNRELQDKLKNNPKINILNETEPEEIFGEKFVSGLMAKNLKTGEGKKIDLNGIFVEIGSTPSSLFVDGLLKCNEKGEIMIDHNTCATSVPGIFAAGDVTDIFAKQIVVAAGEGAKAALSAYDYLKK